MTEKRIIVFGSYITDLTSHSKSLPVPGQTIRGTNFKSGPGGKGSNQAVAAHRAGAHVKLITKIGKDYYGTAAHDFYRTEGMSTEGVFIDPKNATGCALIMVGEDTAENLIVVVPAACDHFTSENVDAAKSLIDESDILLAQLETNFEANAEVIRYSKSKGILTVLNPAPAQKLNQPFLSSVDIVTPNETEAEMITGVKVNADEGNLKLAAKCFMDMGVQKVIITLGKNGVYATDGQQEAHMPAFAPYPVVDTTGAGDAFNGGFVAGLSFGYDFFEAVQYGIVVAGLSVSKFGTAPSMPHKNEILKFYEEIDKGQVRFSKF